MNILFVIPARGGSKGIPRKNVRILGGKPLIQYSIENALSSKFGGDVYVSSEDDEILNISKKVGAKMHTRDLNLAGDAITLDSVIYDTYQNVKQLEDKDYDLIITLQPTSPLLKVSSIDQAIQLMVDNPNIDTIISATEDTHLNWKKNEAGYYPNYKERLNRQYLEPVYKETGGFLITRNTIISQDNRIGKKVHLFELNSKQAIDIDNYEDWSLCEYHLQRKRIVFSVSGYSEIGLGHIYNTLVLANEILDHQILFFCDKKSQLGYEKISQYNYPCHLQESDNLTEEILALNPDVVINDRLDSKSEDISPYKEAGVQVINFEDLGEGAKQADLVFNAIYPEKEKLENHYFGASYFCARDEFLLTPIKALAQEVSNILIAFGGVDPNNFTQKVLDSILPSCIEKGIEVHVVAGLGYQHYEVLNQIQGIHIHKNISNISDYMQMADLAFTSAGRTTYELALMGVPSIVMGQNEREMTHFFATEEFGFKALGLGIHVDTSTILAAFRELLSLEERNLRRQKMLSVDLRNGKKRVIKKIKNLIQA